MELLDLFGPVEILGRVKEHELIYDSLKGGIVRSAQGTEIVTNRLEVLGADSVLVIPGGRATRELVKDESFLKKLFDLAQDAEYVLSICTGSALLAKAGVLNGIKATSNKKAFDCVVSVSDKVQWCRQARWVRDGKIYTSAGVSAGMDMSLGFIGDLYGMEQAEQIAQDIEYIWNK